MGTWDTGPFCNDAALDFVAEIVDTLMSTVDSFLADPRIDEGFDEAFAAIAILNEIMHKTSVRPWRDGKVVAGEPIREAVLRCFDEQIDGMAPQGDFKRRQRECLEHVLGVFVEGLGD